MDNSPQMIFLKDLQGRYLLYNREFGRIFRLSPKQAIGKTDHEVFPPEQASIFRAQDLKVLEAGQPVQFEVSSRQKDGIHTSIVTKFPIQGEEGQASAIGAIITDITERKRLESEVLRMSEHEQQRIARDLHDGLGQQLAGVWFLSDILRKNLAAQSSPELPAATKIVQLLETTVSQTRTLARGLYPVSSQSNGLMAALDALAVQVTALFMVKCDFSCPEPALIEDVKIATNLYQITQEAINNAIKHGKAQTIKIELSTKAGRLNLIISDNGTGIRTSQRKEKGMGLRTMKYRADLIGADFAIRRRRLGGTEVACSLQA